MSDHPGSVPGGGPVCYRHPDRETWIRCQRCDRPLCPDCMRDAAVGFQCPDCVKQGAKDTRQGLLAYGGRRSAEPRLTTFVLIGLNVAVWLAITATGGRSSRLLELFALAPGGRCYSQARVGNWYPNLQHEQACEAINGGDGRWVAGFADGALWQVVTTMFTHVDIWHIAMNMFALFIFGPVCEQFLGRVRFLAVYLVGGLGGSVAVLWLSDAQGSTVGASGALFGLLGAMIVMFTKARLDTSWLMQNLMLGVVITVVGWQSISWQGHLGGLVLGAAAAAVIVYAPKPRRSMVQWSGLAALAAVLLLLAMVRAAALA